MNMKSNCCKGLGMLLTQYADPSFSFPVLGLTALLLCVVMTLFWYC